MFERFSEKARQVVVLAQEEARTLRHNHIGTEHVLLGLARESDTFCAQTLSSNGLTLERILTQVMGIVGTGEEASRGQIPFTPRAKRVLEQAVREAASMGHRWTAPEHILLALWGEQEGVGIRILRDSGAHPEAVRNEVIRGLSAPGGRWRREHLPVPGREGGFDDLRRFMDSLAREILAELHRAPDAGDLLLVVACARESLAGQALAAIGADLDALSTTVERLRREQREQRSELERQTEEVRQAKERAIEAQEFERAAQLRDHERELSSRLPDRPPVDDHTLREIRRRLGLPDR